MSNTAFGQLSPVYAYAPLGSRSSIRVLKLQGSDGPDAEACCTLEEQVLESGQAYEAISYTWEGQTPSQRINCDGLNMLVTENCAAIVRHFRPKSANETRRLWIDAICINQRSVHEKNHQLALMGNVYRNAMFVLVWLAPAEAVYNNALVGFPASLKTLESSITDVRFSDVAGNPAEHHGFLGLKSMIPWFTRLWTVQEVAMAREALFVLGEDTLSFNAVGSLYRELERLRPYDSAVEAVYESLLGVLGPYLEISRELWLHKQPGRSGLFSFNLFLDFKANDPKDKIFAVQGLASALGTTLPDADYSKPISTIYLDAYMALIMHQGQISALHELNSCWLSPETRGLPSWVPQDVRTKILAAPGWHRHLARELYGIRTLIKWIDFAASHNPGSMALRVTDSEALHSCLRLGRIPDAFLEKQSYGVFKRWVEVIRNNSHQDLRHAQLGQDSAFNKESRYASFIRRCQLGQENGYLIEMLEFEILQHISQNRSLSDWHKVTENLGFMVLFTTASGKLGIGAFPIQAGDLVVHLASNHTLLGLRPNADNQCEIVATVYVHDLVRDGPRNKDCEGYKEFVII
ncbi:heterokaryon incompatibility protein-domain-containing protein [Rhypophila decipiens]|uniref:Heterokaryon incompatibility protein-domain-containing protein n=1 Tax=Rhypophila decipiens TaxID=261697 RepID=A0AAN7B4N2_9PEZI|nr:heterokaryon incompatibility protein-domain-containing protein [Rhypophila decipiens]